DQDERSQVRIPARSRLGRVYDSGDAGRHQTVGGYPVQVFVVDYGDLTRFCTSQEVLGPAVDSRRTRLGAPVRAPPRAAATGQPRPDGPHHLSPSFPVAPPDDGSSNFSLRTSKKSRAPGGLRTYEGLAAAAMLTQAPTASSRDSLPSADATPGSSPTTSR